MSKAIYHTLDAYATSERLLGLMPAKNHEMLSGSGSTEAKFNMLRRLDRLVDALEAAERFRTKHKVEETVPTLDQYDTVLDDIHSLLKEGLL